MPKFPDYTELTTPPAAADLLVLVDVSDTTHSAGGTTKKIRWDTLPCKRYVASLVQSGTDAPVATVLENTLGGTVVWSYVSAGIYRATLTNAFLSGKTFVSITTKSTLAHFSEAYRTTDSTLSVNLRNLAGTLTDGVMELGYIEVRVYP